MIYLYFKPYFTLLGRNFGKKFSPPFGRTFHIYYFSGFWGLVNLLKRLIWQIKSYICLFGRDLNYFFKAFKIKVINKNDVQITIQSKYGAMMCAVINMYLYSPAELQNLSQKLLVLNTSVAKIPNRIEGRIPYANKLI